MSTASSISPKRKKLLIIFVVVFIAGLLILKYGFKHSDSIFGRVSQMLFDNNTVELVCTGVDPADIDITWSSEESTRKIFVSGEQVAGIGNEYGPNRFSVTLRDSITFKLGNWKTNRWNTHDYFISITKDGTGFQVGFTAEGVNFARDERHFNLAGELDGPYCSYYENGNLSVKGVHKNGEKDGTITFYYENGSVRVTNEYRDGKAHGDFISYTPDGKIEFVTRYVNGEEIKDTL